MTFLHLLADFSEASILIPFLVMLSRKTFVKSELRILAIYIFVIFVRNLLSTITDIWYLWKNEIINNLFLYNLSSVVGFYILSYIYYNLITNILWRRIIIFFWVVFAVFILLDFQNGTLNPSTALFNKYSYSVSSLMMITVVLAYFYQLLQNLLPGDITKFPYFWLSAGALLYFAGTLFTYIFLFQASRDLERISWVFDAILSIFFNIAIALAFWHSDKLEQK